MQDQGDEKAKGVQDLDWVLLASVLVLMGLGLIMVLSSSGVMAERTYGSKYYFFQKQALFSLLGLGLLLFGLRIRISLIYRTVYLWLLAAIVLLALTLTQLGSSSGGASRWLSLGFFSLQPLELAKVGLVFYLAYFFSHKQEKVKTFSVGFLPPLLVTGFMAGVLLLQPDFGGAAFILALFFLLSMAGGSRLIYLFSSAVLSAAAAGVMIVQSPYRLNRWLAFMHPFQSPDDVAYQVVQSLYALGSGGLWGQGLGAGRQKLFFLPEAHTDFILAVVGEELGFLGLSLVFACLGLILYRCFKIALEQEDLQDRFTALGLGLVLLLGALLNTAVVLGAVPPKGLPLPFVSYGGSNLLAMCFSVGLILNIARRRVA
ncbi:MAG: putative lipid II flippase FtsW [Desulfohalobiaceae bacterium]